MNKTKLEFIIINIKKILNDNIHKIMIVLLLLLISLGLSFIVYVQKSNKKVSYNNSLSLQNNKSDASNSSLNNDINSEIYVDLKGEVKHPGVYKVKSADRVTNVIKSAGGFKKHADQKSVNLSQKVNDQQVIIVNKISPNGDISDSPNDVSTANSKKVNLNTSDNKKLQELDSVGEKKADKIIDYRNQHNGFKSIDELKKISGFGDKTFEKLKDYLEV
ncbi:ComEA family DNA-binding protein [Apilactobacillus micheneri]|uniref:ComEA family DNA-binding protein n=1 Tax=Apilactobacillus micheneri TaxID=1899430 RepID=A0ABY2YYB5_9LACO|nr:helix-hairpin-helix domain-containing protein [Apilactobacillus micheneri]TPR25707.1 ComEA family DNA-binding protein [Apilactobacillus micheneri]TPR26811.1 ComEA family DNA-binding protein [Apilactobacillus micheneri]TPR28599.1 ComEA family DNA-binding protein [Apilactobacillus micheneri]TPR29286.1 ComEA family DNA-binding protein [Apilactobacillus micheneri]TPR30874.1 ComEA family DNA-binding protein [Apilactobacillus micheneri]